MATGLSVFVNIGARVASSVNSAASATERRFAQMGQRLRLINAEALAMQQRLEADAGRRTQGIFEAGMLGFGLMGAMRPAVNFEDQLVRIGNIAGVTGHRLRAGGRAALQMGREYGFASEQAMGAFNSLMQSGIRVAGLDQFQTALSMLDPVLKLAKTAGIETTEAASAAYGVIQNLGVSVNELERAFDMMALAGKDGTFELADMARYMARLTSSAQKMGYAGLSGVANISAALQIVRRGAADAEQAQNNLYNLYEKVFSGETRRKFKAFGVDLEQVYRDSQRNGTDYFEAVLDIVARLSKEGKDPFVFSSTFEDQQARSALQMLILNREEYIRLRDAARAASGVLEADWRRIRDTSKNALDRLKAALDSMAISIGSTLLPTLQSGAEWLAKVAGKIALWAERNPELTRTIVGLTLSLVGLRVVGLVVSWVFGGLASMALRLVTGFLSLGRVVVGLVGRMLPLRWIMVGVRYGFVAMMGVAWPAVAAITAIGVAFAFVVSKWEGIKAFFAGFAKGFTDALGPDGMAALQQFGQTLGATFRIMMIPVDLLRMGIEALFGWIGRLFGPAETEKWGNAGQSFGSTVGNMVKGVIDFIDAVGRGIDVLRRFFDLAGRSVTLGFNASPAVANARAAGAIIGQMSRSPAPAPVTPGTPPTRQRGGPVQRGSIYQINERGQELFAPGRSGTVIPAKATAALLAVMSTAPAAAAAQPAAAAPTAITIHVNGAADPRATADEVIRVLERRAALNARAGMHD